MHSIALEQPDRDTLSRVSPSTNNRRGGDLDQTSRIHPFQNPFRPFLQNAIALWVGNNWNHSRLLEPRQAIIDLRWYSVFAVLDQQVLLGGYCVTPRMCDGVFYVFEGEMKIAPNAKRQVAFAADPVMEFADETPNLIPAVRIHVIGMGSRNDVRCAVLKRQATHGKRHVPRF